MAVGQMGQFRWNTHLCYPISAVTKIIKRWRAIITWYLIYSFGEGAEGGPPSLSLLVNNKWLALGSFAPFPPHPIFCTLFVAPLYSTGQNLYTQNIQLSKIGKLAKCFRDIQLLLNVTYFRPQKASWPQRAFFPLSFHGRLPVPAASYDPNFVYISMDLYRCSSKSNLIFEFRIVLRITCHFLLKKENLGEISIPMR